jgi:hypothetical protein
LGKTAVENEQQTAEIGRVPHGNAAYYEVKAIGPGVFAGH